MHLEIMKYENFIVQVPSSMEETFNLKNDVELATSVSDKHRDLLRPSARSYSIFRGTHYSLSTINILETQK